VEAITAIDMAALAILALAVLRGLVIGLIREVFSVVALVAACMAVLLGTGPAAEWILRELPVELGSLGARIAAGGIIAASVIAVVATMGSGLRRGARWAGLGFFDRLAGGVLGAAEGALVIMALTALAVGVLGRGDQALAGSRTLAAFEIAEGLVQGTPPTLPRVEPPPGGPES
jgi:membrane protein required for colicin V production